VLICVLILADIKIALAVNKMLKVNKQV